MRAILIQLDSQADRDANIAKAVAMVKEAINKNAQFILLPEMFSLRSDSLSLEQKKDTIPGEAIEPLMNLAKDNNVVILAGSIYEGIDGIEKVYNSSALINQNGDVQAIYRKMHLFDVEVGDTVIKESNTFVPGKEQVVTEVLGVKTGLSICFDLRFPEFYKEYFRNGAKMLCVPACFTETTGKAHWEVLLRARAIENQCFVLAPNQVGSGQKGVMTYGNSMIIDPWGRILARGSDCGEELVVADLDFDGLEEIRKKIPIS